MDTTVGTNSGFGSTAAWLAWRIDIGIVAAREHVRVARALGELKLIDNAFAAGEPSYSKVRAMTRVATPEIAAAYRRARVDPATPAMDVIVSVAQAYLQHSPRTLGSDYELVILTTQDQLEHGPGGVGGFLRDGTPVPLHIARMLACDCSRVDVETSASGEFLDVGRARRTIPPRSAGHHGCATGVVACPAAAESITCRAAARGSTRRPARVPKRLRARDPARAGAWAPSWARIGRSPSGESEDF